MLWILAACTPDPPVDPEVVGPYAAGVTTLYVTDARGKDLVIEVWYPAVPGTGEVEAYAPMTLRWNALRDAEVAEAPEGGWPLVGFSHGSQAIRFQSAFLTEHLATHGFVVAAPDHTFNTMFDQDGSKTGDVLLQRPDDVRSAVDATIEAFDVDGSRWAVIGHSFGALTAMLVGGGVPDLDAGQRYCEVADGTACGALDAEFAAYAATRLPEVDPRVVSTVAMSPFAWYAFGEHGEGLAEVRKPLVLGGTLDPITEFEDEIVPVFDAMTEPRSMLVFDDAGHYPFSDICELVPQLFDECDPEAGYADLLTVQRHTLRSVTAHLYTTLLEDWRYEPHLEAPAWEGVGGVTLRR